MNNTTSYPLFGNLSALYSERALFLRHRELIATQATWANSHTIFRGIDADLAYNAECIRQTECKHGFSALVSHFA